MYAIRSYYVFICGEGLGHTSRCLALGKEFLAAGVITSYSIHYTKLYEVGVQTFTNERDQTGLVGKLDMAKMKLDRVKFADAQVHRFQPGFDLVFSRFGVMFFEDPVAAFANLHRALVEVPGDGGGVRPRPRHGADAGVHAHLV